MLIRRTFANGIVGGSATASAEPVSVTPRAIVGNPSRQSFLVASEPFGTSARTVKLRLRQPLDRQMLVGAASRSYYADLLNAGIKIYETAKTIILLQYAKLKELID